MTQCLCDREGSIFFLSLSTTMQMFLHVSCLSQTLSFHRQAILSLASFLIIASALKQTPLQGFCVPLSLPAPSWTALRGLQAQGCAKKGMPRADKALGKKAKLHAISGLFYSANEFRYLSFANDTVAARSS